MITKSYFDTYNGKQSYIYELSNDKLKVGITDFGGAIQYLKVVTPSGEKGTSASASTTSPSI